MRIERYIKHEIQTELHSQITELRNACFPDYQRERSYYKQIPHLRFLAYSNETLIGHLGIDHRVMTFNHITHSVFGIIDLCVHEDHRRQGLGQKLLSSAEVLAMRSDIDVMVLLADDVRLYEQNGFMNVDTVCQWLRIDEHTNYGVAVEEIKGELLLKPLTSEFIVHGPIDFLGYLF